MDPDLQEQKARLIMKLLLGVLNAMVLALDGPRELFVPTALRQYSYENASLPIACAQTTPALCSRTNDRCAQLDWP